MDGQLKKRLTQEVAYGSVLIERRKQLHERAGTAPESMVAAQLDDHLEEMAHHYRRSDNFDTADLKDAKALLDELGA